MAHKLIQLDRQTDDANKCNTAFKKGQTCDRKSEQAHTEMRMHIGNTFCNEHMYELSFTSHAVQPGAGISVRDQLGCSFHDGFVFFP